MDSQSESSEIDFDHQSLLAAGIGLTGLYFVAAGLLAATEYWGLSIITLTKLVGKETIWTLVLPGTILLLGHRRIAVQLLPVSTVPTETTARTRFLMRFGAAILGVWLIAIGLSYALGSSLPPVVDGRTETKSYQYERTLLKGTTTRGFAHILLGTTLFLNFYLRTDRTVVDASTLVQETPKQPR